MGSFFALIGFAFIGPVVSPFLPVLATEAMAILYAGKMGVHPLWIGLACAIGQNLIYTVLYFAGYELVSRWPRLHRQIEWVRLRYANAQKAFFVTTISAMFLGIPPALPVAILARGFGMKLRTLLIIAIPMRFARFAIIAAVGGAIWPTLVELWEGMFSS